MYQSVSNYDKDGGGGGDDDADDDDKIRTALLDPPNQRRLK